MSNLTNEEEAREEGTRIFGQAQEIDLMKEKKKGSNIIDDLKTEITSLMTELELKRFDNSIPTSEIEDIVRRWWSAKEQLKNILKEEERKRQVTHEKVLTDEDISHETAEVEADQRYEDELDEAGVPHFENDGGTEQTTQSKVVELPKFWYKNKEYTVDERLEEFRHANPDAPIASLEVIHFGSKRGAKILGKYQDEKEARENLRELLPPSTTVYTILRDVSSSGMYCCVDMVTGNKNGGVDHLPFGYLERIGFTKYFKWNDKHHGFGVGGRGTDVGFEAVYNLSCLIYKDGFPCIGERCPSTTHSNGDHDYTVGHMHNSNGGYALKQRWL